jgi:hypothetical protein
VWAAQQTKQKNAWHLPANLARASPKIQRSLLFAVATLTENVMTQSVWAYLLGPFVMALVGVALWAGSHYHHHDSGHRGRRERWLDTHPVDWMHHRH